ncbi:MAG: hypothetical protein U0003_04835 [Vampirovibrionales bacterium]
MNSDPSSPPEQTEWPAAEAVSPLPETVVIEDWLTALHQQSNPHHKSSNGLSLGGQFTYPASEMVGTTTDTNEADVAVQIRLRLQSQGMQLHLSGCLESTLPWVCDRCLAPLAITVSAQPDETFLLLEHLPKAYQQEEWVTQYADDAEAFAPSDTFDLKDWVRQWVVLAASGQHVCADCQ